VGGVLTMRSRGGCWRIFSKRNRITDWYSNLFQHTKTAKIRPSDECREQCSSSDRRRSVVCHCRKTSTKATVYSMVVLWCMSLRERVAQSNRWLRRPSRCKASGAALIAVQTSTSVLYFCVLRWPSHVTRVHKKSLCSMLNAQCWLELQC